MKGISKVSKTYHIATAMSILEKFNSSKISEPQNIVDLNEFAESLVSQGAKTIEFGIDDVSLKFLLDKAEFHSSIVHYNRISSDAKQKFVNALIKTFYNKSFYYTPVVITDRSRTMDEQAKRVFERGYQYYMDKVPNSGTSYPYLEILKKIYVENQELETVLSTTDKRIKDGAKDVIRDNYGNQLETLKKLIDKYFNPSFHTFGQSLDIRTLSNHAETARQVLTNLKGYETNDHIHLNLN